MREMTEREKKEYNNLVEEAEQLSIDQLFNKSKELTPENARKAKEAVEVGIVCRDVNVVQVCVKALEYYLQHNDNLPIMR